MIVSGNNNSKVTVILRSVGERTTETSYELIKNQVTEDNIIKVSEIPFTEAVRKTFLAGIEAGRKWTFVVDADVLLLPGVIKVITDYADSVDENIFKIEGRIIDKFLDSPRAAGTHLYRTSLLEEAVSMIPGPYDAIRPETFVRNAMQKQGYSYDKTEILTGFHDFEQYYRDIYRKAFVQAKKHQERADRFLIHWQKLSLTDNDFKVALRGFADGECFESNVAIDAKSEHLSCFNQILGELNINEKSELGKVDFESIATDVLSDIAISMKCKENFTAETLIALNKIRESKSYKIGRMVTAPFRAILGFRDKENDR